VIERLIALLRSIVRARCRHTFTALGVAAFVGCAAWTDADVRETWEANRSHEDEEEVEDPPPPDRPRRHRARRYASLEGWPRVTALLRRATLVLERRPEPEVLARIARKLCRADIEPQETEDGWVRVCEPMPPVSIDEHDFTLEVALTGSIGLIAHELGDDESTTLVETAVAETETLCLDPWRAIASSEFHTCPVEGGSTLAVGRVPSSDVRGSWEVVISILGAT
jgi:hypothetical protein